MFVIGCFGKVLRKKKPEKVLAGFASINKKYPTKSRIQDQQS